MTVIEVKVWADFEILVTDCIMVSEDSLNKDDLLKEFCQISGIASNIGLPLHKLNDMAQDFKAFLAIKGFTRLETQEVYFCD